MYRGLGRERLLATGSDTSVFCFCLSLTSRTLYYMKYYAFVKYYLAYMDFFIFIYKLKPKQLKAYRFQLCQLRVIIIPLANTDDSTEYRRPG
jgi:hypothetical protein